MRATYDEASGPGDPHYSKHNQRTWEDPYAHIDILVSAPGQVIDNMRTWRCPKTGKMHHV